MNNRNSNNTNSNNYVKSNFASYSKICYSDPNNPGKMICKESSDNNGNKHNKEYVYDRNSNNYTNLPISEEFNRYNNNFNNSNYYNENNNNKNNNNM